MPLTDIQIRNAKPQEKPVRLFDGYGLYLEVAPRGGKYWRLKYRFAGKEKLLALGVYPQIGLREARERRDQARQQVAAGVDPGEARKEAKRQAGARIENALEVVAREWHEKRRGSWKPGHADRVLRSLELEIFPRLGARPMGDITPLELLETLRQVESRGALETAARVLQRVSAVYRYGIIIGRCRYNPAADLRGALEAPKFENYKALAACELPEFLRKLDAYDGHIQTRLALKLLVLTFVRTGELRAAEWPEFNLELACWRIPAERMKMKESHLVPLSRQAVTTIEQLRLLNGRSRFLFTNQHNHEKCMSENTMLYALYRMGYHSRATGHGFRTTASTILNETGFHPDVIERQLAHRRRDQVRAAYNKAEYLPERCEMMQHWADYLDVLSGDNVTPIRRRNPR
ncbi:MAG: tyrosine-type recombinase/integrase [Gammaproteobacteria bacterium]